MKINYRIALEVATHEAIVRQAYKDSVGKWTWSIGLTSATGHKVERYIRKPQSLEHCLRIYVWALERYAAEVRKAFTRELTEEQFAAALSFHWNTGSIGKASWVRHFNDGNMVEARERFMRYNKPPEIIERREKERDLFFEGKWSQTGRITEYTRVKGNGTPDWSSGKRINIKAALTAALEPKAEGKQMGGIGRILGNILGLGGMGGLMTSCNQNGTDVGQLDLGSLLSSEGMIGILLLFILLSGNTDIFQNLWNRINAGDGESQ